MKSMCEIAALIVLLSITSVTTAFADNSVTVTNSTSYTLTQLYASPSSASSWDTTSNLLAGGLTVLPGAQLTISIGSGGNGNGNGGGEDGDSCNYDLMGILYGAKQYAYSYSVNTCSGGNWTISGN
jgi:hypothetical protein